MENAQSLWKTFRLLWKKRKKLHECATVCVQLRCNFVHLRVQQSPDVSRPDVRRSLPRPGFILELKGDVLGELLERDSPALLD